MPMVYRMVFPERTHPLLALKPPRPRWREANLVAYR